MMSFANASFLLLLLLLPLLPVFYVWRERQRSRLYQRMGDVELIRRLSSNVSQSRRRLKFGLWLVAVVAVVVALARPRWGVDADHIETQGISIMVLLDVSRSMNADDVVPDRLERAKLDLRELMTRLDGEAEVGIILFAGSAYVYLPATTDVQAAEIFLNSVSSSSISGQGTAIDRAIELAVDIFDERLVSRPIVILMSDGENLDGDPFTIAQALPSRDIVIHSVGYGTDAGTVIPIYSADGNVVDYLADSSGNLVVSRLDEVALNQIALLTGGTYRHSDDIDSLIELLLQVEDERLDDRVVVRATERFGLFLLIAVIALSFEILLPETRRQEENES